MKISLRPLGFETESVETERSYVSRMKAVLPNFPDDVIEQWLFRHWMNAEEWEWLGFHEFEFARRTVAAENVPLWGIGPDKDAHVKKYTERFAVEDPYTAAFRFIVEHFDRQGTWPRPVIYIETGERVLQDDRGYRLGNPMHLLEGHKRLSVFYHYLKLRSVQPTHDIWVVTRADGFQSLSRSPP